MVFRKRYWLYYGLTFMAGARRQIFIAFAVFLLVKKFSYTVSDVAALFLLNNWLIFSSVHLSAGGSFDMANAGF